MEHKVDTLEKHLVFDDKFKIHEAKVRYMRFDGQMSKPKRSLVFERGDSTAAIIANTETHKILLTEQFRYPAYENGPGWLLEAVAGVIDQGEQPEETLRREIKEEMGYEVHNLKPIATFYVSPGGSSERIFLYYAEVRNADHIGQGGGLASENEDVRVVELSPEELWQQIQEGALIDAKTLIGAQWLQQQVQKGAVQV
jgi:ADP-ribose pyrophosphatase